MSASKDLRYCSVYCTYIGGVLKWWYPKSSIVIGYSLINHPVIELDDGKIETGNPIKFDGRNPCFS